MAKNSTDTQAITIRAARQEDVPAIKSLLRDADLPADDAGEHWKTFLVAVSADDIVGTVGLEITGSSGLLRSLVVTKNLRGRGLGKSLYERIVEQARLHGLRELGLLTTTAEGFFSRAGFHKQQTSDIPAFIASSKEYRLFCPSTAVIMTKKMD